jgi:hypothetical protein
MVWAPPQTAQLPCPACGAPATLVREQTRPAPAVPPPTAQWPAPPPAYPAKPPVGAFAPYAVGPPPYGAPYVQPHIPRPRSVKPAVVLLVLTMLGLVTMALIALPFFAEMATWQRPPASPPLGPILGILLGALVVAGLSTAYFVTLLIWLWRVHKDMEALTYGRHSPTAGLAIGLMFVPVLSPFWLWHCLRRLAARAAKGRGAAAPAGAVVLTAFLVISIAELLAPLPSFVLGQQVAATRQVTAAYLAFQIGTAILGLIGNICLAIALTVVGRATADCTAVLMAQASASPPGAKPWPAAY